MNLNFFSKRCAVSLSRGAGYKESTVLEYALSWVDICKNIYELILNFCSHSEFPDSNSIFCAFRRKSCFLRPDFKVKISPSLFRNSTSTTNLISLNTFSISKMEKGGFYEACSSLILFANFSRLALITKQYKFN